MNKKEQAIAKGKFDSLQLTFLEAMKKNPKNENIKSIWERFIELSSLFDNACQKINYFEQAALERDDKFFLLFEEHHQLKLHVAQLETEREVFIKRINEYESGMTDNEKKIEYKINPE